METILNVKGDNLKFAFYDIFRILTIQIITQFLFVMNNSDVIELSDHNPIIAEFDLSLVKQ